MLHIFSTNRVKFVARTPTATVKKRQREYVTVFVIIILMHDTAIMVLKALRRLVAAYPPHNA